MDEVSALPDRQGMAPCVLASYDTECNGTREAFPTPDKTDCYITMIATIFQRHGEDTPFMKHCVALGGTLPPDKGPDAFNNVTLVCVKTEAGLLIEWVRLTKDTHPDVLTGCNTLGFDCEFIYERAKRFQLTPLQLSRYGLSG